MAIKIYSALALAAFGVGGSFMACGPAADDSDPTPTPTTTTGMPVTSAPGTTTTADPGTSTAATTTAPAEPNDCDGPGEGYVSTILNDGVCETTAPPNCIINEFAANFQCPTTGSVDGCTECCWGDDTSLTGGPISYQDVDSTITYTHEDGLVRLTGSTSSYAGFGLWFGPCTDASMWDGLEIQITGDLGGGQLFVQLQTDENYPAETDKGSCPWTDEAEKWNVCSNPQVEVEGVNADSLNPFRFTWSDFTGGQPNSDVDPRQLRGIQIQMGCAAPEGDAGVASSPAEPCAFNLELLDLRWYKAPAL